MRLAAPEWLILLPLLVFAAWKWPGLRLRSPLRAICALLLLAILTQPQVRRLAGGLDLWVLVDRSVSVADKLEPQLPEWQKLLERAKGPADRVFYVDYADVPVLRGEAGDVFPGTRQATRTESAMQFALSRMRGDRAARLLVWSDGYSTEPLANVAERLIRQEVPLDYRLVSLAGARDFRVETWRLPARVQAGAPFLVELLVAGSRDETITYEVFRDGQKLSAGEVAVRNGRGLWRFTDRLTSPGAHEYRVQIGPGDDERPGNNSAANWVEVVGGPRVVLVSNYPDDPLAAVLQAQGFTVELITDLAGAQVGRLAGAKAVVLNNVPAYQLPREFLESLDFFVRAQGGGLWMVGGKYSFGSGGYFQSPVDALLPVSMELREEHRKLAVAMAIVLDRSGSMAAGVPGGPGLQKMDLANEGAARAVELLGPRDQVTVIAVDSEPHFIVPLVAVGANRAPIIQAARSIRSMGGGIFVYTGLQAAWNELQKAQVGQRHVILFADAADAEEPGDYITLLAAMTKAGAKVSVIGLGSEADSDANFLKDVAARGGGRIFFNADPTTLPALFAQETVAIARSAFIEEVVKLTPRHAGWVEVAARPLEWPGSVDGYNLSYLRPEATASAISADEYAAPLVAHWQRGVGRVAAVSFPLGGPFSQRARAWPQYGDFVQTLTRWLMGEETPPGIGLQTRLTGNRLTLDLLYDESWEERFAQQAPQIALVDGATGTPQSPAWERLEPGHYTCEIPLAAGSWVRGAVQVGRATLPFGPLAVGVSAEWSLDHERVTELQRVAALSGGAERLDLSKIWQAPRRAAFRDLRQWLLVAFLGFFLIEALVTRLGWHLPEFAWTKTPATTVKTVKAPTPAAPTVVPPPPPPAAANRRHRFERAKRGE